LMGDVIGYIRDLLVRQAAPGQAQTGIPTVEKLLVLLDHFAEAESRLRWASDKRLYFDVAVIKAVHLLDQTSLSDVIDTLAAIGEGRDVAHRAPARAIAEHPRETKSEPAAPIKSVPLPSVSRVSESPSDAEPPPPSTPVETLPQRPTHSEPPQPANPTEPEPEATRISTPAEQVWREVAEVLSSESFIRFGWLQHGKYRSSSEKEFRIEFPVSFAENTQDFFWMDLKKQVEESLSKKQSAKIAFIPEFSGPELEERRPLAAFEEEPSLDAPPSKPEGDPANSVPSAEEFHNDPKIRKALNIFKAQIEESKK